MSESPFFQFYPSDWLAGTRGLTASETGVYITLVAMMYEAEGPVFDDPKRLARLCGSTPAAFKKAVDGLLETGKLTKDDRGYFNGRVEIEIEKRSKKRASASSSANLRWKKNEQKQCPQNANASVPQCERNANQKPEARVDKSDDLSNIPTSSDDAGAPVVKAVEVDPINKAVWDFGVPLLSGCGVKNPRPVIGGWLRDHHNPTAVLEALRDAQKAGTKDPVPYIKAILKGSKSSRRRGDGPQIGDQREFGGILKEYAGNGTGWVRIYA